MNIAAALRAGGYDRQMSSSARRRSCRPARTLDDLPRRRATRHVSHVNVVIVDDTAVGIEAGLNAGPTQSP